MTPKQKRAITTLAVADIVVILALVVLMTHPFGTNPSPFSHSYTPPPPQQTCQWQATQLLAQAGLGGTVTLTPDGPLRFEIAYPIAPGQAADEAAQSVWTAFDVALALQEQEDKCAIFTQVEVVIPAIQLSTHDEAHSSQTSAFSPWQVSASVSTTDLMALSAGELSEDEFIERVTYIINVNGN